MSVEARSGEHGKCEECSGKGSWTLENSYYCDVCSYSGSTSSHTCWCTHEKSEKHDD